MIIYIRYQTSGHTEMIYRRKHMGKSNFSELVGKVKAGAKSAAKKVMPGKLNTGETDKGQKQNSYNKTTKGTESNKAETKQTKKDEPPKNKKIHKKEDQKAKLNNALREAVDQYNDAYTTMNDNGATLYRERIRAVDMIMHVEDLINSIANRPKDFDTEIAEIKTNRESFIDTCEFAKQELEAAKKSALGAGAGVATGAAIVSVAPSVAMWVATTFGKASTGTAISTLSGAAAKNAALAWLGGGALAAGGGGMAAGHALLALAGPIGWGIAGVTLLSSIVLFRINKLKLDKKKKEQIEAVKNNTNTARKMAGKIQELINETVSLRDNLRQQYNNCLTSFGHDFTTIPREQQIQLGMLVNNTKSLASSFRKSIQ
jgi:hypothetical protein